MSTNNMLEGLVETAKGQNLISPSATCSWINIFIDPETTFQSTNQI